MRSEITIVGTSLLGFWIGGYLLHLFPLPAIYTWWSFPWILTFPFISFAISYSIVEGGFRLYERAIKQKNKKICNEETYSTGDYRS